MLEREEKTFYKSFVNSFYIVLYLDISTATLLYDDNNACTGIGNVVKWWRSQFLGFVVWFQHREHDILRCNLSDIVS